MELHPLQTAAVRILFCGRPALTTGVVNLRVLLGGDGQYCLAEKRKAKLHHSSRHGTRGDAAVSNGVEVSADSEEKRESVYRVCSSEGLPDGCYYVKADRHYWVMHMKGELRAAISTAAAPTHPSASLWNTQATLASSPMPLAATASTAEPSKVEEDVLARRAQDQGTAASAPAEAAGAMAATAESSSALAPADGAARAGAARKQKVVSTKRKCTRRLKAVGEGMEKLPLITTTFSDPGSLAEASPTQEQQQRASMHAVDVVGDVEEALGEQLLGTPLSARQAAKVATDVLVTCEETPPSLQQQEKQWERRKKTSRVHVDAVAEDCKGSEADAAGGCVSAKKTRDSSRTGGGNDLNVEVVGGTPLVEQLVADASQPPKQPQHRGKRRRSDEVTAEDPPALPSVRYPSTQVKPLTSSFPETSPLPTPEKSKAARRKMGLRQDEDEASAPASSANLRDATLPLPSALTGSDTESAPMPASPACKSRKSSTATSAAFAAAASDAADTATLSKIPAPPLSPLSPRSVPGGRQITRPHGKKAPNHAGTNTASLAHPPPRQAPPQQQQQEEENPPVKRSPASAPQETTPNILYSNRSSDVAAPTARDIMQQQQHGSHSALNSPSTQSQVGADRSASTSSLLGPLLSPLLQRQSQWGGIGGGAAGSRGLHESMMSGGSGGGGFFPSDSPALGFTQVHSTLAEEFSLDVSETESSSAASEYLCDLEE
ncbi:hypothetical protein conserved [Leishmania donovani]|uniref:Hypothetical_protein_conserved n=1 Tax=Leishmania donovani TaxID=5661 RepID=A0A6J8FA22_LEIDO|nr:hypothetical protein conserved [Leishmania donovani]VDZ44274.1 hypothetical_protein_conserved [Leishmania donovani]